MAPVDGERTQGERCCRSTCGLYCAEYSRSQSKVMYNATCSKVIYKNTVLNLMATRQLRRHTCIQYILYLLVLFADLSHLFIVFKYSNAKFVNPYTKWNCALFYTKYGGKVQEKSGKTGRFEIMLLNFSSSQQTPALIHVQDFYYQGCKSAACCFLNKNGHKIPPRRSRFTVSHYHQNRLNCNFNMVNDQLFLKIKPLLGLMVSQPQG